MGGPALAQAASGGDPAANFRVTELPSSCSTAPAGPACIDAAVSWLDRARASLGQGPYQLPGNFDALSAPEQAFVLTNLDRVADGLVPITGLTDALDGDAARGVRADDDPGSSDPHFGYWASNWAGAFANMPLAYEAWMYDDGFGSGNLACTSPAASGCWAHRHDVLWPFAGSGPLAMGAAAGRDPSGSPGYAMLLGRGDGSYRPAYVYTWTQAVAAGAAGGPGAAGDGSQHGPSQPPATVASAPVRIRIHVRGRGTVTDQNGHACSRASCSFSESPGTVVRLSARARGRAVFVRWSGGCTGRRSCQLLTARSGAAVTARFATIADRRRHPARPRRRPRARISRR